MTKLIIFHKSWSYVSMHDGAQIANHIKKQSTLSASEINEIWWDQGKYPTAPSLKYFADVKLQGVKLHTSEPKRVGDNFNRQEELKRTTSNYDHRQKLSPQHTMVFFLPTWAQEPLVCNSWEGLTWLLSELGGVTWLLVGCSRKARPQAWRDHVQQNVLENFHKYK
uniref:Uncharacterized protein n=1 Tax=Physcomitrium patens TaxID=3218 RepID=A0A2K1KLS9_PHYPA|nr:hypothetical protein PHYPA_005629 [Physcomitrium patens]